MYVIVGTVAVLLLELDPSESLATLRRSSSWFSVAVFAEAPVSFLAEVAVEVVVKETVFVSMTISATLT